MPFGSRFLHLNLQKDGKIMRKISQTYYKYMFNVITKKNFSRWVEKFNPHTTTTISIKN